MRVKLPVRRSAYKTLSQPELALFALNVSKRMSTNPDYQGIAEEATALGPLCEQFNEAINAARDRSIQSLVAKKRLSKLVVESLDRIVDWMAFHYTGDELWVINAGFPVYKPVDKSNAELEAPFNLRAEEGGGEGEILLSFDLADTELANNNSAEYSPDGGQSWIGTRSATTKSFVIGNLPRQKELLFRVRSNGTRLRESKWSEYLRVYVY